MLEVTTSQSWAELRRRGLLTVIDPMIYRAGEMFLRGRKATGSNEDARAVWVALSRNIDGLTLFFDELVLDDQPPIFDYSATYDDPPGLAMPELVARVNERPEILVRSVGVDASEAARAPAVAQLSRLPSVDDALMTDVVSELSAFDYRWRRMLQQLRPLDDRARAIATFRYGALLFAHRGPALGPVGAARRAAGACPPAERSAFCSQRRSHPTVPSELRKRSSSRAFGHSRTAEPGSGVTKCRGRRRSSHTSCRGIRGRLKPLRIAMRERKNRAVTSYRKLLSRVRADLANGRISRRYRGGARRTDGDHRTSARPDTTRGDEA